MDEKKIELLKNKLSELNPLGENAKTINDLNNYEIEAFDILFHVNKKDSRKRVEKMIQSVFEQAFSEDLNDQDCTEITDLVMILKREN